jgi:predicted nucleic acid-binding Zn ribbon protein
MKRAKYLSYGERREPKEISDVLGSVIESASVNIDVRQGELIGRWREVAPGDWVDVAIPVGIRDQTLLVEVGSGTAGSLLKYQTQQLIDAISEEFGEDLVTSVRLQIPRS